MESGSDLNSSTGDSDYYLDHGVPYGRKIPGIGSGLQYEENATNTNVLVIGKILSELAKHPVHEVSSLTPISRFVASRIESGNESASFLVTNLSTIINQWDQWKAQLPMVEPFYGKVLNTKNFLS